jgi:hypothetical protein
MSLADILDKYPVADGYLQDAVGQLSAATPASGNHCLAVKETAPLAIGVTFLVPLIDTATQVLPAVHDMLRGDTLWFKLIGKSEKSATTYDLVCDIVGGQDKAGDRLLADQTGITLQAVHHVFVPEPFVLDQARRLGLFQTDAPLVSSRAGNSSSVLTLSKACGVDLEDNEWECTDKKDAQSKMFELMALTRMWSKEKVLFYAPNIKFDYTRLYDTCMRLRTSEGRHADTHMDAGLHMFAALHGLVVMKHAPSKDPAACFATGSKFQHALLLRFNAMDHTHISLLDFLEPAQANAALFERGRFTATTRGVVRSAMEFFETFFAAFSSPAFSGALEVLSSSLRTDPSLWNRFDDAYLLFKISAMLQAWAEDVRTHKRSDLDPAIDLSTASGCATLLRAYAAKTPAHAAARTGGWTEHDAHFYARDHGLFHLIQQRPKTTGPAVEAKKRKSEDLEDLGEGGETLEPKTPATKTPALKTAQAAAAKSAADIVAAKTQASRAKQNCVHHVMQQLGVETSAGQPARCTAGAACEFKHNNLSDITKSQAVGCSKVRLQDRGMSEAFKAAVDAKTDWKVYEAPTPSAKRVKFEAGTK